MCVKESCYETTVVAEHKGHYNPPVPLQKRRLRKFGVRVEGIVTSPPLLELLVDETTNQKVGSLTLISG